MKIIVNQDNIAYKLDVILIYIYFYLRYEYPVD